MPRFKLAHLREQGIDLIVIPLEDSFGNKADSDQTAVIDELQMRATSAGLAGTVVPVWNQNGRMHFVAPQNWHPFFRSISMQFILANLNREIWW